MEPRSVRPQRVSPLLPGDVNNNPADIGFFALIAEDFRTHDRSILDPGFWAIAIHRYGNWRMGIRPKLLRAPFSLLYRIFFTFVKLGFGIELPYVTALGRRVRIWHHGGIVIGARAIGDEVQLRHNTTIGVLHSGDEGGQPVIGSRVDIGCGAVIAGAIEVGDDVVIGANTVVVKDVPPDSTVFGVPARPVRLVPAAKTAPESKPEGGG
jgi:serine O-acetyltransferase